jgi:hypothetical protein
MTTRVVDVKYQRQRAMIWPSLSIPIFSCKHIPWLTVGEWQPGSQRRHVLTTRSITMPLPASAVTGAPLARSAGRLAGGSMFTHEWTCWKSYSRKAGTYYRDRPSCCNPTLILRKKKCARQGAIQLWQVQSLCQKNRHSKRCPVLSLYGSLIECNFLIERKRRHLNDALLLIYVMRCIRLCCYCGAYRR